MAQHIETGPVVSRYLVEKDLELPSTGRSSFSRGASSTYISSDHGAEPTSTRSSTCSYPSPRSTSVVNITVEQLTSKSESDIEKQRLKIFSVVSDLYCTLEIINLLT